MTWPRDMDVYVVIRRRNGSEKVLAIFSENALSEAIDWGSGAFDEFHAADPGLDSCTFLKKRHGVRFDLR